MSLIVHVAFFAMEKIAIILIFFELKNNILGSRWPLATFAIASPSRLWPGQYESLSQNVFLGEST